MKAERIDHVAVFVKDLDKATKFFSELLETEFPEPWTTESFDIRETVGPLPFPLDLCEPMSADGPAGKVMEQRGEGVSMISFKVKNLEEAVAEMKARGIRQLIREPFGNAEYAVFHPKDTFGVMIELIEYKEKHPTVTAGGK
jgi:methylmalonyl-CoA/ethylmalonyl-CoA epimerase